MKSLWFVAEPPNLGLPEAVPASKLRPMPYAPTVTAPPTDRYHGIFRSSTADGWLVLVAAVQTLAMALVLAAAAHLQLPVVYAAAALTVAVGLWWNANTVAHIHLHVPIFRDRLLNRALSAWLSALLGFPQVLWRHRHFWHHAGEPVDFPRLKWGHQGALELGLVGLLWGLLAWTAPHAALFGYLPGYALGMALCQLQGHFEHHHRGQALPGGVNFGARWYNKLWFNDGMHIEHHRAPSQHWTQLRQLSQAADAVSPFPPVLRWMEHVDAGGQFWAVPLAWLEQLALAVGPLQQWMVRRHVQAFSAVLATLPHPPQHVLIVGGGLFPRTLLVLRQLLPDARLVIVDAAPEHLDCARNYLTDRGLPVPELRCARFDVGAPTDADLVVLPLAFVGDIAGIARQPGPALLLHRWMWHPRLGRQAVVSALLCKRVDLLPPR